MLSYCFLYSSLFRTYIVLIIAGYILQALLIYTPVLLQEWIRNKEVENPNIFSLLGVADPSLQESGSSTVNSDPLIINCMQYRKVER